MESAVPGVPGRWALPRPPAALLAAVILAGSLAACSRDSTPRLSGVRSLTVEAGVALGAPHNDDVRARNTKGAVLHGPHYTLGVAWTATSRQLGSSARELGIAPLRAAKDEQLFLLAIDPKATFSGWDLSPETAPPVVKLDVGGTVTEIKGLPLPAAPVGALPSRTQLILVSSRPDAPIRLTVTDAGRMSTLDLRAGMPTAGTVAYVHSAAAVTWDGEGPASVVAYGRTIPLQMSLTNVFTPAGPPPAAILTTYRPENGYAAPGRGFLEVPAPAVTISGFAVALGLRLTFDDAQVASFAWSGSPAIRARPHRRSIDLITSTIGKPETGMVFDVRVELSSATVVLDLGRAQMMQRTDTGGMSPLPWTGPPAFRLAVDFR